MQISIDLFDIEKEIDFFEKFKGALAEEQLEKTEYKDIDDRILNEKVDFVYKNMELSFLFSELMFKISFLRRFSTGLTEKVDDFYKKHSEQTFKRNFILEDGKIKEAVKGTMEVKRKEFIESPFFKNIKEQLKISSQ